MVELSYHIEKATRAGGRSRPTEQGRWIDRCMGDPRRPGWRKENREYIIADN